MFSMQNAWCCLGSDMGNPSAGRVEGVGQDFPQRYLKPVSLSHLVNGRYAKIRSHFRT